MHLSKPADRRFHRLHRGAEFPGDGRHVGRDTDAAAAEAL